MTPLHYAHFDLKEAPFTKQIVDDDLWLPPSKTELVDDLVAAVREHQSVLLVGDPGVGKTCVLRALRHRLGEAEFRLTYCHNATLGRRDFYRQLCVALNLTASATAAALFYAVSTHVQELGRASAHPTFVLDEAHLLHQDTLDHLHILLNYEWDSQPLLSLVMVGLSELVDRLTLRRNKSLYSRLFVRRRIEALTPDDTADYLRYRLERVGGTPGLFAHDAVGMLHEAASGSLRDVDRIATACLTEAAASQRKRVERDVISRVLSIEAHHRDLA